jgi:hypothetical protein
MSIIATYARLDPTDLDRCRSNPQWLQALWDKNIPSAEVIDLDKAWAGIDWLLSRLETSDATAHIAGSGFQLIRSVAPSIVGKGGTEEPSLQAGYGPAKLLSVEQVRKLSHYLLEVSTDSLRKAFDGPAMDDAKVYPQFWTREGSQIVEDYLLPHFEILKEFIGRAAEGNQAVLVFFT